VKGSGSEGGLMLLGDAGSQLTRRGTISTYGERRSNAMSIHRAFSLFYS